MVHPTTQEFIGLIDRFVNRLISATEFEATFLDMMKSEEGRRSDAEYWILDALFGDVDAFVELLELRDPGDLDEDQLRTQAGRALELLNALPESDRVT